LPLDPDGQAGDTATTSRSIAATSNAVFTTPHDEACPHLIRNLWKQANPLLAGGSIIWPGRPTAHPSCRQD
jgi:hypothetical protein